MREHDKCQAALTTRNNLPYRIIDISDPQRPFLAWCNGHIKPYVTLSYKWGNASNFLTTSSTALQFQQMLPLNEMPKTFKDAIFVAGTLRYRFI
jgi:hypothetical protein